MKKNYANFSFIALAFICIFQLFFITSLIYLTTELLINTYNAYSFIISINTIPLAYYYRPIIVFCGLVILLAIMNIRKKFQDNNINFLLLVFEIIICFVIMYATSFASNAIILLVIANMLQMTKDKEHKGFALAVFVILYLLSNYNIISNIIPIINFDSYLNIYNYNASSLFMTINDLLYSISIMLFIFFILFFIQDQYNESKKIKALNEELNDLNVQLKGYAEIKEKMGETKERNRLAREIHDTLGHTLTGIATGLDACITIVDSNTDLVKKQLQLLSNVAKEGLNDVRRSVSKLRIDALDNHTLKYALEKMIAEYENTTNAKIHFICHLSSLEFQLDEEEAIYRIVQESCTNAIRHGKASEIFITFGIDSDKLIIIIEDNGIGCKDIKEGFGLHHMKERVKLLNGTVRYYSTEGFSVIVEVPIRKDIQS